jgi:hypothetical protein
MATRATASPLSLKDYCDRLGSYSAANPPGRNYFPLTEKNPLDALSSELSEIETTASTQTGEHIPSTAAIKQSRELIQIARSLIHSSPPDGEVDFYYNELAVEWRNGNRILRLTSFPVEAPRLDYGTMSSGTQGEYHSDNLATGQLLAQRLDWLSEPVGDGGNA